MIYVQSNTLWCDHYGVLLESEHLKFKRKVSHAKGQGFDLWAEIFQSEHSEISCSQIFTNNKQLKEIINKNDK